MMIALAILGMGLLVIAAALPIGIRYTRDSINMATGEAAADYALDLIEQSVGLPRHIFLNNIVVTNGLEREAGLFEPRNPTSGVVMRAPVALGGLGVDHEPVIKVRALYTQNVSRNPATYGQQLNPTLGWAGELAVNYCLGALGVSANAQECDPSVPFLRPALPSVAIVYPPITTVLPADYPSWGNFPYSPSSFFVGPPASMYQRWPVTSETTKVAEQRTVWNAFYRRVSYEPGSDPDLYEFITVVSRLPSGRHRFPGRNTNTGLYSQADDSAAPIPWLVTFATLPAPPSGLGFDLTTGFPRPLGGPPPATMTFILSNPLNQPDPLPVGSIFIPARNDLHPTAGPALYVGFGPPAPTTLPIYEVVGRPDAATVVTKFNGYYPMQGVAGIYAPIPAANSALWPVWVIPPAYEELDGSGNPLFPNRSTIIAVARRYVRLREIP